MSLTTDADAPRDLAWESARIAEALASVAAGRLVSLKQVDHWLDSLDTNQELPAPRSGR